MVPCRENHREYLWQAIDAEIKSLEESTQDSENIRALRHRRNTLAPVSSLPFEVIAAIFSLLRVHVTSVTLALGKKRDPLDRLAWLRVTHVCHQWRKIALNHPLLWSHVDFATFSLAGVAEILARAKKAPLYLEACVPGSRWDGAQFSAFQKELQDRVSHICHLTISAKPFYLDRILKGFVSPAPTLEYLWLSSEEEFQNGTPLQASIPDTFFDGTTPRLSCIKLQNCNISWQSPLLRGLTHLEIRTPFVRPSLSVWLDALDKMPQLKTLGLHWASPVSPGTLLPSHVERSVTLSFLILFELSSSARDCGFALAHLILPALTSLCLVPKLCHQDGSDVREILPYVTRHAHGPQDTQPLQSMFFHHDTFCTEILAWPLPDIDIELPDLTVSAMRSARVALRFMNGFGIDARAFDAVVAALPLDGLVTLTLRIYTPRDEQFWRRAPRWPLLQRVRLSPLALRGFREMVLEDNVGHESPLLPSLKELVLIETRQDSRGPHYQLRDVLMKRAKQGVPLRLVHVPL